MYSYYLEPIFNRKSRDRKVRACVTRVKRVERRLGKKVLVVGRGVSGSVMAAFVANAMNRKFIVVRKRKQGSHSATLTENDDRRTPYVIIDDLIDTGNTVRRIIREMKRIPEAIILYNPSDINYSGPNTFQYNKIKIPILRTNL